MYKQVRVVFQPRFPRHGCILPCSDINISTYANMRWLQDQAHTTRLFCSSTTSSKSKNSGKLTFIGGGKMAEVMIAKTHNSFETVNVVELHEERRAYLQDKFNVTAFPKITNDEHKKQLFEETDVVVLAVKPQNVNGVFENLRHQLNPKTLVVSIVAGVSIAQLQEGCNTKSVCRTMPNTPAMIGAGITVWTATDSVSNYQKDLIKQLLDPLGKEEYVDDEDFIDMATAVSGSGPAYTFLFMEASIESAVHMGLPRGLAKTLTEETMKGAIAYAQASKEHPAILRNDITSPGGTTAAATYKLEEGRFRTVVTDAIWAAYQRARQLGGKDHKVWRL